MKPERIACFTDLEVYQVSYEGMLLVIKRLLPQLPSFEKWDLIDQLRRSSKAVPRLISEGYAKRHQRAGFQRYLDDAMGESNETVVGVRQSLDLYGNRVDNVLCEGLIRRYNRVGRQIYRLAEAWTNFKRVKGKTDGASR